MGAKLGVSVGNSPFPADRAKTHTIGGLSPMDRHGLWATVHVLIPRKASSGSLAISICSPLCDILIERLLPCVR